MNLNTLKRGVAALALVAASGTASAVPALQLGIDGGVYDPVTQTIISTGPTFTLYAFLDTAAVPSKLSLSDTYYVSAALIPKTGPLGSSLGSFAYAGNTVNVTADMTYGNPPIDTATQLFDSQDLSPHGIFPTYFSEFGFNFSSTNLASFDCGGTTDPNNTAQCASLAGLTLGTTGDLYYAAFTVDTTLLALPYVLHFDLYNTEVMECGHTAGCTLTDTDVDKFAPFSHDAQSSSSTSRITSTGAPEPGSSGLALLGLGLLGASFWARRKSS